jgi:isoleucyl-tRNA synthetase
MKAVSTALTGFSQEQIALLEKEGQISLQVEGETLVLQLAETEISSEDIPGWTVAGKGKLTVALDITVTPELEAEGYAREFVNRIQKIRKDAGFELTDRVLVKVQAPAGLTNSLASFKTYICDEILADSLEFSNEMVEATTIEINEETIQVQVTKKG